MPVTVVVCFSGRIPMMSTVSLIFNTPRSIRPVTTVPRPGDREDVLNRHQERLLGLPDRLWDRLVDGGHQLEDRLAPLFIALERLERRDTHHRSVVTRELVLREQFADLELDELHDLFVIDHVGLVEGHDDVGNADLAGQEDVLLCLRHRTVSGGDDEDRTVHLCRAGDHVLDVVSVTGAVDVSVVTASPSGTRCARWRS